MNWNDDRLDRLANQVDDLRRHIDERFEKQDARIDVKFENFEARMDARFDALQRSMTITLAGILAAFTSVVIPTVF
jgi:hypothetical protein